MKSLRSKILITSVALVLACQLITVVTVLVQAHAEAGRQAEGSLEVAGSVVGAYLAGRQEQLQTTVRVLTDDFGFRSAVASRDADTVRSVLRNHSSRIHADYAVLFDAEGRHVAATTDVRPELVQLALIGAETDATGTPLFAQHDGVIYQSVIVAVMAPMRIGWVAMGFAVDDQLAGTLGRLTGTRVTFHGHVRSSDLAESPGDFVSIVPLPTRGVPIHARLELGESAAMGAFHTLARSLVALAGIAVALTCVGALSLSRSLTRPLARLLGAARRIGQGDYTTPIEVGAMDEFGELAETVSTMQGRIEQRERDIRHQAEHDALTGLPNRQALLLRIARQLEAARPLQVLVISVRGINEVTSTLGLELGDAVVQTLASAFADGAGHLGFIARIADTRFCLVTEGTSGPDAETLAAEIKTRIESRPVATTPPVRVKVSVGIAASSERDGNATSLLRRAWMASLQADGEAPRIARYDASGDEAIARRRRIVEDLETVTRRDGLFVVFQPRFDSASNRFASVEALLRWEHPDLGFIPPDQFIPLAEGANSIGRLTRWVLEETVDTLCGWHARGIVLRASVNVSAGDVADPVFPLFVASLLDRKGLDARYLELEITETAFANDLETMVNSLRVLRGLGIELAIDDFGTGFSSLSQLKKLPVQRLKIDKSFVMKLAASADDQHMVRSIIALAHGLGLTLVAEGVEDAASAELLRAWGCEELQGYLFSRPVVADALEALLIVTDHGRRCFEPGLPRKAPVGVATGTAVQLHHLTASRTDASAAAARLPGA